MIKIILKAFLLMTFTFAAGLANVSHAQSLTGEWVGNSEPPTRTQFLRLRTSRPRLLAWQRNRKNRIIATSKSHIETKGWEGKA